MKKLTALLLALVMVLAMNATAFAADAIQTGIASKETGLSAVTFKTEIHNYEGQTPVTSYTYTITEATGMTAPLINGVDGGVKFAGDPASKTKTINWTANDGEPKNVELTLNPSVFPKVGVYRYMIAQSANTTEQTEIGLHPDAELEKALDVYVVWADDNHTTKKINNVVLTQQEKTMTPDGTHNAHATKVEGWKNTYGKDNDDDPDTDADNSFKLDLSKAISGSMASTTQLFNFALTLTYSDPANGDPATTLDGMSFKVYTDANMTTPLKNGENDVTATVGSGTVNVQLKGGDHLYLKLPKSVNVNFKETYTNPEKYSITSAISGQDNTKAYNAISTPVFSDTNGSALVTNNAEASIAYTNTLKSISPTGVVLRIAPYAIMLGAGVVLFIILKSRKNKAMEEA